MDEQGSFRDAISTVDEGGRRRVIYPKQPKGKWYGRRKWVSYFLLAALATGPFITVRGNQLFLFNVIERRFNFFGVPFWPQDFYLVVLGMIVAVIFVSLFTVVYGRLFCGWVCPQTIFLEMVFRRIDYWIEGDRGAQKRLADQPWNAEKIRKRSVKWALSFVIAFLIANIFLAYFRGSDTLVKMVLQGPDGYWGTFIALVMFTLVFFFVFIWFREQVCTIACPYGRLQGVLLDDRSINVAYDFVRGEGVSGRGKFRKDEDRPGSGKGDCIDCRQCVNVCPMGIDIRNGTQLECTNCTACIDECDAIMSGVGFPGGLIRYASEAEIETKAPFRVTLRMKGYTAVLLALVSVLVGLLFLRTDLDATVLRLPGQLYERRGDSIRNVYTFHILNKTNDTFENVSVRLLAPSGNVRMVGSARIAIPGQKTAKGTFFIDMAAHTLSGDKETVRLGIYAGERLVVRETVGFLGPRKF